MADKKFTVLDLLELQLPGHDALNLTCIAGRRGIPREITAIDINRPGLALTGFFKTFAYERVQLFGRGEVSYLAKMQAERSFEGIHEFFKFPVPCCVFTYGLSPIDEFIEIAEENSCPILKTDLPSTDFLARMLRIMSNVFAPKKTMHGVFMEVYGIGILLTGHSGVGKSETALALVERGHRLVADDLVEIVCVNGNEILGHGANKMISHHMEIRGLGIINVSKLYGVGAIRDQKEVQLIIKLEDWDPTKVYERVGAETKTMELLGVKIPYTEIPVKPGRNIPIIIEAAAMNERLKDMGYNSARDFNQNVLRWIETEDAQAAYYGHDDSY